MSRAREPVRIVPKGWGREVWIANGDLYCGKILEIRKGKRSSLHYHKLKTESFYLRSGRLKLRIKESPDATEIEELILEAGQCMDIPTGTVHQLKALEDVELYEFSTQHFDSDSHRLLPGDGDGGRVEASCSNGKSSADNRSHRAGRLVPRGIAAAQGLRGTRSGPPYFEFRHRTHRPSAQGFQRERLAASTPLRRPW